MRMEMVVSMCPSTKKGAMARARPVAGSGPWSGLEIHKSALSLVGLGQTDRSGGHRTGSLTDTDSLRDRHRGAHTRGPRLGV